MHRNNKTVIKIQHKLVQKTRGFRNEYILRERCDKFVGKKTQLPHTHTLNQIKLNTLKSERTLNYTLHRRSHYFVFELCE